MGSICSRNAEECPKIEAKTAKAEDSAQIDWKSTEFKDTPVKQLFQLEPDNDVKRRLKQWCKKAGMGSEAIELYEEVNKRRIVFQASQRCGDDIETAKERAAEQAQTIIDKYLWANSPKSLVTGPFAHFIDSEAKKVLNGDLMDQALFDELCTKLVTAFENIHNSFDIVVEYCLLNMDLNDDLETNGVAEAANLSPQSFSASIRSVDSSDNTHDEDLVFETQHKQKESPPILPWRTVRREIQAILAGSRPAGSLDSPPSTSLSITIPHGFQLVRSILHPKANVKSVLYLSSAASADTFAIMDAHFLQLLRGSTRMFKMPATLDRSSTESSVGAVSQWLYIPQWKIIIVSTRHLQLRILDLTFETLSYTSSIQPVLREAILSFKSLEFIEDREELIAGGTGNIRIWTFTMNSENSRGARAFDKPRLVIDDMRQDEWVSTTYYRGSAQRLYAAVDSSIYIYNSVTGRRVETLNRIHDLSITAMVFHEQLQYLITASKDSTIKVWSHNNYLLHHLRDHTQAVTGLAIPPAIGSFTSPYIVSCSLDSTIKLWDLETGNVSYRLETPTECMGIEWMKRDMFCHYSPGFISTWNLNRCFTTFTLLRTQVKFLKRAERAGCTARLLACGEDGSIRLISPVSGAVLVTGFPVIYENIAIDIVYGLLTERIYVLATSGNIVAYDSSSNPCAVVDEWKYTPGQEKCICFDYVFSSEKQSDSFRMKKENSGFCALLGGTNTGQIIMFDVRTTFGKQDFIVQAHTAEVIALHFDQKSMQVISIGNGSLRSHGADDDHTRSIAKLIALDYLNLFATSGEDRTVKIWDGSENTLIREIQFGDPVGTIAFANPRGDLLVGMADQIVLVRLQDYLPQKYLQIVLDQGNWVDDAIEVPTTFDSSLDFWGIYRSEMERNGVQFDNWHVQTSSKNQDEDINQLRNMAMSDAEREEYVRKRRFRRIYLRNERHAYQNAKANQFENTQLYTKIALADLKLIQNEFEVVATPESRGRTSHRDGRSDSDFDSDEDFGFVPDIPPIQLEEKEATYTLTEPTLRKNTYKNLAAQAAAAAKQSLAKSLGDDLSLDTVGHLKVPRTQLLEQVLKGGVPNNSRDDGPSYNGANQAVILQKPNNLRLTGEEIAQKFMKDLSGKQKPNNSTKKNTRIKNRMAAFGALPNSVATASVANDSRRDRARRQDNSATLITAEDEEFRRKQLEFRGLMERAKARMSISQLGKKRTPANDVEKNQIGDNPKIEEVDEEHVKVSPVSTAAIPEVAVPLAVAIIPEIKPEPPVDSTPQVSYNLVPEPVIRVIEPELDPEPALKPVDEVVSNSMLSLRSEYVIPSRGPSRPSSSMRTRPGSTRPKAVIRHEQQEDQRVQNVTPHIPVVEVTQTLAPVTVPTIVTPMPALPPIPKVYQKPPIRRVEHKPIVVRPTTPVAPPPPPPQVMASNHALSTFGSRVRLNERVESAHSSMTRLNHRKEGIRQSLGLEELDRKTEHLLSWRLFRQAAYAAENEAKRMETIAESLKPDYVRPELAKLINLFWFPGLGNKPITLQNIVEVLFKLIKTGYWLEKVESARALLYLYHTFEEEFLDPLNSLVLPQIEAIDDENWQVREQMCASLVGYGFYHPDLIMALIQRLHDEHPNVSKESLKSAMVHLRMVPSDGSYFHYSILDRLLRELEHAQRMRVMDRNQFIRIWLSRVDKKCTQLTTRPPSSFVTLVAPRVTDKYPIFSNLKNTEHRRITRVLTTSNPLARISKAGSRRTWTQNTNQKHSQSNPEEVDRPVEPWTDLVDRFERLRTLGQSDAPLPNDDELAHRLEKLSDSAPDPAPAPSIVTKQPPVQTLQKQDFGKILDSDPALLSELSELYEDSALLSDLEGLGYEADLGISTAGVPSKNTLGGGDETPEEVKAVARLLRSEQKPVIVDFIELENATSPSKATRRRSAGGSAHDVKSTPRSNDELARFRKLVEKQPVLDAPSAAAADPELAKILSQLPTTPTHAPPGFSTSSPPTTPSRNAAAVVSGGDAAVSALVSELSDQINLERKHAAVDAAVEQRWRERVNGLKDFLPAVSSSSSTPAASAVSRNDELGAPPAPPSIADFELDGKGKEKKWKGKALARQRKKTDSSSESESSTEDSAETSSSTSDESD
ncbi:hypothetical protein BJ742DRAFT_870659 [Cladochytrium replicatum]|nr:hypothetical protein BJ742DRAFT_870659 [Cladochytrium replicatum]